MYRKVQRAAGMFEAHGKVFAKMRGLIGFDGFVDKIAQPVKYRDAAGNPVFFGDMAEFGAYIVNKRNHSCCIELDLKSEKMGGNAPILANALECLGISSDCIGAMGFPEILPVFGEMSSGGLTLYSYAEPGYTTALEFSSGKLMLAVMENLRKQDWDDIVRKVGIDRLRELFEKSSFISLVNWSEIYNTNGIWEGILRDVLKDAVPCREKMMFFDLSDCSGRDPEDIRNAFRLMKGFASCFKVVLGMNDNETERIYKTICSGAGEEGLEEMGKTIFETSGLDIVVVHSVKSSIAWEGQSSINVGNYFTENPKITTGGGDHFNAGFCAACAAGWDVEASMILGNAVSGFYVRNGYSPSRNEILDFLNKWSVFIKSI